MMAGDLYTLLYPPGRATNKIENAVGCTTCVVRKSTRYSQSVFDVNRCHLSSGLCFLAVDVIGTLIKNRLDWKFESGTCTLHLYDQKLHETIYKTN